MLIRIASFQFEVTWGYLFIRVPWVGEAFLGRGLPACFNPWRECAQ